MKRKYFIPYYGLYVYYKSFEPIGIKYGLNELFGFFIACYHACLIGFPIGFILSNLIYKLWY